MTNTINTLKHVYIVDTSGYQCDRSQTWLQWMNWCYVSRGTERQTLIHGVYNKHLPHYPHHSHHTSLWTHSMYIKAFHSIRPITVPSQRTYVHQSNNCMVVPVSFHSIRPITVPSQRTYVLQSNNCMVVAVSMLVYIIVLQTTRHDVNPSNRNSIIISHFCADIDRWFTCMAAIGWIVASEIHPWGYIAIYEYNKASQEYYHSRGFLRFFHNSCRL